MLCSFCIILSEKLTTHISSNSEKIGTNSVTTIKFTRKDLWFAQIFQTAIESLFFSDLSAKQGRLCFIHSLICCSFMTSKQVMRVRTCVPCLGWRERALGRRRFGILNIRYRYSYRCRCRCYCRYCYCYCCCCCRRRRCCCCYIPQVRCLHRELNRREKPTKTVSCNMFFALKESCTSSGCCYAKFFG